METLNWYSVDNKFTPNYPADTILRLKQAPLERERQVHEQRLKAEPFYRLECAVIASNKELDNITNILNKLRHD